MTHWKPTLGTISKAQKGAITCNFSESGGPNCSNFCPLKKSGKCYGMRTEQLKSSIAISGRKKRLAGIIECCQAYEQQLRAKQDVPWLRFSSFGSLPHATPKNGLDALSNLLKESVRATGTSRRVHLPVESMRKYRLYAPIAAQFDITVRLSTYTPRQALKTAKKGIATSLVMAKRPNESRAQLLTRSQHWARKYKGAMVCPAIADTFNKKSDPTKCGKCKACAYGSVSIVVYPEH